MFAPMRGKDTTVGELIAAADRVTAMYKTRGYALSFAFVPNQTFAGGVVKIQVVEGYVSSVDVRGDAGNLDARIRAMAAHIVGERPLRQETFERYTQLLGQLPGLKVAANVAPPTTTDGAAKLDLDVKRQRYDLTYGLDFNHPGVQGVLSILENGATPLGEQLSLSTLFPNGGGQRLYSAAYLQPIGSRGWQGEAGCKPLLGAARYRRTIAVLPRSPADAGAARSLGDLSVGIEQYAADQPHDGNLRVAPGRPLSQRRYGCDARLAIQRSRAQCGTVLAQGRRKRRRGSSLSPSRTDSMGWGRIRGR